MTGDLYFESIYERLRDRAYARKGPKGPEPCDGCGQRGIAGMRRFYRPATRDRFLCPACYAEERSRCRSGHYKPRRYASGHCSLCRSAYILGRKQKRQTQ